MTTGIMPLLDIVKEVGVDIFFGPDPIEGGANLQQVKERIGKNVCLWGGMNAPVTLGKGKPDQIENAVKNAINTLAPGGGFILSALDSIILGADPETCGLIPWENIEYMIRAWRKNCKYPTSIR
jgi:uroporphyrinogen decarboxylase